ncbi:rhomboid family intramembrane serine protease [Zavarzinella formosa]|uniref:rhomboid family intramembrane serine protease n=1 Tax=Zavarzinella formosa TaxID=360055 RepID=UPI00031B302C|nr:rhomboid family intramembrane serine protease [Zavarzinella formosa]
MPEIAESSLRETLLRAIAEQGAEPWLPRLHAEKHSLDLESLYSPLNDLRIANLIQLTEWQQGHGQGYQITELGREVLRDPVFLLQMHKGLSRSTIPVVEPLETVVSSNATPLERGDAAREAIYGFRSTPIIYVILAVNIVAFLITLIFSVREGTPVMRFLDRGDVVVMAKLGAAGMPELAKGEWYRLVTCCFLHFGLLHITLNMTSLYLSRRIENVWGSGRLLILYVICGICGSVTSMLYEPGSPDRPLYLAGASGALWGIMTSHLCWLYLNRRHFAPAEVQRWMASISYTLLLNIGISMLPNVSMAAHLGGGIAGLIATPLLQIHRFGAPARRLSAGVLLALLPSLFLTTLAMAIERDSRLKVFVEAEKKQAEPPVTPW